MLLILKIFLINQLSNLGKTNLEGDDVEDNDECSSDEQMSNELCQIRDKGFDDELDEAGVVESVAEANIDVGALSDASESSEVSQVSQSTQIENKKTEYISISEYEAITDFLPNANLNYRDGTRRTAISSLRDKQKDEVRTLNIKQPLFSGFSGVSRYSESLYKTRSAEQNLKFKKK